VNDSQQPQQPSSTEISAAGRFCLRCGTEIEANEPPDCGQCGLQFNPNDPDTYRTTQMPLRWKSWLPGLLLSVVIGVGTYSLVLQTGEMGWALFFAVPVSFGAILGYTVRGHLVWILALSVVATLFVAMLLYAADQTGAFCGLILAIVLIFPAMFGAVMGWGLGMLARFSVTRTPLFRRRRYLPILLIASFPLALELVENHLPHSIDIATVQTDLEIRASDEEAWDSLMFYEDVEHEPPWLLKLALPRPVRTEGTMESVGDVSRCVYENGHLTKQTTERVENRRLAFRVVEQEIHFERDVTLLDGSFELEPTSDRTTRMRLTTRYIRHLRPAWLWEPIEQKVVHTLHRHVLEGIRRNANRLEKRAPEYDMPTGRQRDADLARSEAPRRRANSSEQIAIAR
jgi:hypothetical protein